MAGYTARVIDMLGNVSGVKAARKQQYRQMFAKGGVNYNRPVSNSARSAYNTATRGAVASAQAKGKRRLYGISGVTALGAGVAMRPNPNQQQTMYRGPMNTGRGIGRYS